MQKHDNYLAVDLHRGHRRRGKGRREPRRVKHGRPGERQADAEGCCRRYKKNAEDQKEYATAERGWWDESGSAVGRSGQGRLPIPPLQGSKSQCRPRINQPHLLFASPSSPTASGRSEITAGRHSRSPIPPCNNPAESRRQRPGDIKSTPSYSPKCHYP